MKAMSHVAIGIASAILVMGCGTARIEEGPSLAAVLPPVLASTEYVPGDTYFFTKPFAITRTLCFGYVMNSRRPSGYCEEEAGCDIQSSYALDVSSVYALAQAATSETCESLFADGRTISVGGDLGPEFLSLLVDALSEFLQTHEAVALGVPAGADVHDLAGLTSTVSDGAARVRLRMIDPEARDSGQTGYIFEANFDLHRLSDARLIYHFKEDMLIRPDR